VLLQEGNYKVHIDAKKFDGVLNYGELLIPGQSSKEIFLSTYVCHPSMANNELSGPAVLTYIAKWLQESPNLKYSYRIVFLPETIGSIAYLSKNFNEMKKNVVSGFNVSCVGDERSYSYVPSRKGNTISDQIAKHVLRWTDPEYKEYGWLDRGSDERQYCAPGIDLPIASILRTKYGEYPEYHTSLDDLENVVTPEGLEGGYEAIKKAIMALERNSYYRVATLGEPLMSKRGLRSTLGTKNNAQDNRMIMGFISYCDGETSLLEIAEMLSVPIWDLYDITEQLVEHEIILEVCN
jgi:aminopeptidase-like protein